MSILIEGRQNKKAKTREKIKVAALDCFEEHGFAATQISHMTQRAGVAQGTFYVHFADKEALVDELLREFNVAFVEQLAQEWGSLDPGALPQLVRRTAHVFLRVWQENKRFLKIYLERLGSGLTLETLRDGINPQTTQFLTDHFILAFPSDHLNKPSLWLLIQGILALWQRIGLQAVFNPDIGLSNAEDVLVKMTLGALNAMLPPPPETKKQTKRATR